MKISLHHFYLLAALWSLVFLLSCSLGVQYIGESYSPKVETDVFYDERDISNEYKTMGHLLSSAFTLSSMAEQRQAELIKEARQKGADAIIFDPIESIGESGENDLRLKARLIKYTD